MDYKEKYEQALEKAKVINPGTADYEVAVKIFPELKKSEDEEIRYYLIEFVKINDGVNIPPYYAKKALAWLEKQKDHEDELERAYKCADEVQYRKGYEAAKREFEKQGEQKLTLEDAAKAFLEALSDTPYNNTPITEAQIVTKQLLTFLSDPKSYNPNAINEQKPADKVEPKFKVGDWVKAISSGNVFKILSVNDGLYRVLCYDGVEANYPIEVEKDLAYWTIKDAKNGDVLATKDIVFIFKHMDKTGLSLCKSYCEVIGNSKLGLGFDFSINDVHPATKEQRDILFQKMNEAGYEWDAEKKELKKIEKPSEWSEEDEQQMKSCFDFLDNISCGDDSELNDCRNWLKSIKERIKINV